jgi:hypothetical protein
MALVGAYAIRTSAALTHPQPLRLLVNKLEARCRKLRHGAREGRCHAQKGRRRNAGIGWCDPVRWHVAIAIWNVHFRGVAQFIVFLFSLPGRPPMRVNISDDPFVFPFNRNEYQ